MFHFIYLFVFRSFMFLVSTAHSLFISFIFPMKALSFQSVFTFSSFRVLQFFLFSVSLYAFLWSLASYIFPLQFHYFYHPGEQILCYCQVFIYFISFHHFAYFIILTFSNYSIICNIWICFYCRYLHLLMCFFLVSDMYYFNINL